MTDYAQNADDERLADEFLELPVDIQRKILLRLLTRRWSDDIVGDFSDLVEAEGEL